MQLQVISLWSLIAFGDVYSMLARLPGQVNISKKVHPSPNIPIEFCFDCTRRFEKDEIERIV
jgi:hypothetical protein